jgi:cell division protein FtsB
LLLILTSVLTGLVLVWMQTRREYAHFEERRSEAAERLAELRRERESKEAYLRAFLGDPDFVERVIRERMGYVEPGEIVFRFENR